MKCKGFLITFAVITLVVAMVIFTGCQDEEAEQPEEMIDYEIAFITDDGLINDRGTSEVVWNTVVDFASSKGLSHKYYKATQAKENAVREVLDTAVSKGAKIVIVDNNAIADVIYKIQDDYKDIRFVTINANPYRAENGDIMVGENTTAITFATEQAGFMAGYAAVREGYDNIGSIVQGKDQQMLRFQYGFAKGANRAAQEIETESDVVVNCVALEESGAREAASAKAKEWYKKEISIIFVCGDKIEDDVIEQAELLDGKVIGGITDKGEVSDTVVISSVENIDKALKDVLQKYTDDEFPGGEVMNYGVAEDGVLLDYTNSRLKEFDVSEYEALVDQIKSGKIRIKVDNIKSFEDLELEDIELKY